MGAGEKNQGGPFAALGPNLVLDLVEKALGIRCSNLFRPMNSYINRVYELETLDRTPLMVKFYRPGRWQSGAIEDEHRYLLELAEQEIPVIPPLLLKDGSTLGGDSELRFALFPKCGGRCVDEFNDDQWLQLGRLLGRVHNVGACKRASERVIMRPGLSTRSQLTYLEASGLVPQDLLLDLGRIINEIVDIIEPLFQGVEMIRIHGDCHFANLIHRPDEGFYLIDFDDMVMGPPVQDLWMLLPGDLSESFVELDYFLEGYETFRPFDRRSFRLVEPLRAMRFIHYMAWCCWQVAEDGATQVVENFGSRYYWDKEIADLHDQKERLLDDDAPSGNML